MSLDNPQNLSVLRTSSLYLADTEFNKELDGWGLVWVREFDRKFGSEGRYIPLVIDNCPAHPQNENKKLIKLFFTTEHNINNTAYD